MGNIGKLMYLRLVKWLVFKKQMIDQCLTLIISKIYRKYIMVNEDKPCNFCKYGWGQYAKIDYLNAKAPN